MTNKEAVARIREHMIIHKNKEPRAIYITEALEIAIKALEQQPIDKSAMMYEIYMEGINMSGEYQGCWVRFKDIEKIVDKYMAESDKESDNNDT